MKVRNIAYVLFVRIPIWYMAFSLALVMLLKWIPVKFTPLMLRRASQFRDDGNYHSEQKWVSLEEISPELINAILFTEDQRFWQHHGFDWVELQGMWQSHRRTGGPLRGCSTISQQTAKNVFTFGTHTYARKVLEAWWTCLIEHVWGKNRILEVYLNVVETGMGLYGVEAACDRYFGKPASDTSAKEAVALAVCLPHPLESDPINPSPYDRMRRSRILDRLSPADMRQNGSGGSNSHSVAVFPG